MRTEGEGVRKVVYKYPLQTGVGIIAGIIAEAVLPEGAEVLSVIGQRGQIALYALVDPEQAPSVRHHFLVVPTGYASSILAANDFLGTVALYGGDLVFHIFRYNMSE